MVARRDGDCVDVLVLLLKLVVAADAAGDDGAAAEAVELGEVDLGVGDGFLGGSFPDSWYSGQSTGTASGFGGAMVMSPHWPSIETSSTRVQGRSAMVAVRIVNC